MYTYSRMEGKKKRNCPIDDEGLRFIIAREHRTQKKNRLHPFPTCGATSKCEFFLVDVGRRQSESEHTLRRFLVMCSLLRKSSAEGVGGGEYKRPSGLVPLADMVGVCECVCSRQLKANVQIVNP